jgi:hypothetical protein
LLKTITPELGALTKSGKILGVRSFYNMNISLIITEKQIQRKSTGVTDPDPVTSVIFLR